MAKNPGRSVERDGAPQPGALSRPAELGEAGKRNRLRLRNRSDLKKAERSVLLNQIAEWQLPDVNVLVELSHDAQIREFEPYLAQVDLKLKVATEPAAVPDFDEPLNLVFRHATFSRDLLSTLSP